jgi:hypothetical protein
VSLLVEHPFFQDCQFFILRGFPWGSIVASCSPASRRLLGHSACGIEEPKKEEKHKQKPDCAPCPAAELAGKPDQALPPLPDWAPFGSRLTGGLAYDESSCRGLFITHAERSGERIERAERQALRKSGLGPAEPKLELSLVSVSHQ